MERNQEQSCRLSVVIPVYNEVQTIEEVVQAVLAAPYTPHEVVVVDDCSTDGTLEKLETVVLPRHPEVRLLTHSVNRGKGAALKTAFEQVTGDVVVVQDADLEYDPRDYPRLIDPILQARADVVYGSRFSGSEAHRVVYFWHMVGNRFLTLLSNMLTDINLSDMETGYKAFRREILDQVQIQEARFGFEPEITAKVARLGCRIYEVGISYRGRTYDEGKKITWRDGCWAVYCILKYNLLAR